MFYNYFHAHLCNWLHIRCAVAPLAIGLAYTAPCTNHRRRPMSQLVSPLLIEPLYTRGGGVEVEGLQSKESIRGTSFQLIENDVLRLRWLFWEAYLATRAKHHHQPLATKVLLGGGVVAPLEPSTLGYRWVRHGWLFCVRFTELPKTRSRVFILP